MTERHPLLDGLGSGHGVVTASAGTGKTYFLECVVADLVQQGMKLDEILVVTFTHKAVEELKQRVRRRILDLITEGGDAARITALRQARRDLERASILTIHGFCQQALQDEAFASGRPLKQEVAAAQPLRDRAFLEALRKGLAGPTAEAWREAIRIRKGPEKLGAWIGKLLPEMDRLEPSEADLAALLAPFKDVAAFQELAALEARVGPASSRKAFIGFLERVETAMRALPDVRAFLELSKDWVKGNPKWWAEFTTLEVSSAASALREAISDARFFPVDAIRAAPLLLETRAELERIKAAEGLLDFDDMIRLLREAMDRDEGLAARLAERFKVGLLDEAQDTSEDQWAILWRIFGREDRRLILVGDAKQAIYGFQGGDLPAFQAARDTLVGQGATSQSLDENWRSTPEVVEACNGILKLGEPDCLVVEPLDAVADFTAADLASARACGNPAAWEDAMPAVQVLPVPFHAKGDEALEAAAEQLAETLMALRASAPRLRLRGGTKPLSYSDCFVLVRNNSEADLLGGVLRARGVPFLHHKARALFASEAAEDLEALFRALEDPSDPAARGRALLTPFFGLSLDEVEAARDLEEDHPVCQRLREWADAPSAALFDMILGGSGVVARLLAAEPGQRRLADLLHLTELLQAETGHGDGSAEHRRRLERWRMNLDRPKSAEEDARRLEQEGEAVRILTLHAAKGLEAPVVALFGGLGDIPSPRSKQAFRRFHRRVDDRWQRRAWTSLRGAPRGVDLDREDWAEERRLLYVGLTRAQGLLILPFHGPLLEGAKRTGASPFDADGFPKGPYGLVQRRLAELREAQPSWMAWGNLDLPSAALAPAPVDPRALPAPAPFDAATLRRAARPLRTESFTSLHRRMERARAEEEPDPEPDHPAPARGGVPGGTATGVALHAMLETAPFEGFEREFRRWWTEARRAWAEVHCRAAGLDEKWAEEAARLAHAGFGTPLRLPSVKPIAFADLDPGRVARELDFLASSTGGRLTGALDAIFEHEGRAFVLDWKSNRLEDYDAATVAACVEEDYALQVKVYTLAALRFLRIEDAADYGARFGGVIYVFLRGLPEGGQWSSRPVWSDVLAWREELRARLEEAHA
jgi:exodeoxyribonuclease V beta subunit